jgi:N-alpha-acetyl-L-2,4-diaminobutyrate deacetylase
MLPRTLDPPTPIVPTVDFDRDGVQHGVLRLPWSRDASAWGSVPIPICIVRNGDGPTALLTGGNHGDEYEGPIALFELARTLTPAEVQGRVIIVPAMNYPAFLAGRRTSPIDGGNLNRSFPGRPDGTPTEKIADFFQRLLLPLADIVLDFHSGGGSLDFVPFAATHMLPDKMLEARALAAVKAFGAPLSGRMLELDGRGMYDTAAEEMGKVFVTTEIGGGATARLDTVAVARRGVRNVLIHAGILSGEPEQAATRWFDMPSNDCFVLCDHAGIAEPLVALGSDVAAGQVLARIHPVDRTGEPPVEYRSRLDGILVARHYRGLVDRGDCLAVVAVPTPEP